MTQPPTVSSSSFTGMDAWGEYELGWHELGDLLGLQGARDSRHFLGRDTVGIALAIQCADVKAQDVAKAEMLLWKRAGRGWTMVDYDQHPIATLLMTQPNEHHTWTEFWRMVIMHLELSQNAYVLKRIARDGSILELIPILPARCRARVSPNTGAIFYEIFSGTEYERAVLGGDSYLVVPAAQMIHLRGRLWDGLYGLSSLTLGSPLFDLISAISDYQTNLFGNDGKQPIVFEMDGSFATGDIADAAFQRLKRQLAEKTRKSSATGEPLLLENGLKAKTIALNARDATTTESFNQVVMRICGLMRCPPHKIFALESVAYNNMAAMNGQYYSDCLHPLAKGIQETFRNSLFPITDWPVYRPIFDEITLQATDLDALKALVDMSLKNGVMTFNEAREILPFHMNPVANGDRRMMPVNMAMIGADGNIVAQAADGQANNTGQPPVLAAPGDNAPDEGGSQDGKGLRLAVNNG